MKYIAPLLAAAFLFASCSKQTPQQKVDSAAKDVSQEVNYKSNVSLVTNVSPSQNNTASNFSWYDTTGKLVSLESLRGKAVLVNFWATWCGPCKMELPDLESLSREYSSKGLVIIGVSVDRGDDLLKQVSSFAESNGLTYQIVIDNANVADAYGNINAIPTSFMVDKNGTIASKWVGVRDRNFLESEVKKYLD